MSLSVSPLCRRLRKHLPGVALLYSGAGLTRRQAAEHEAAHAVAAIAVGGVIHFAHIGETLGGSPLGSHGHLDGIYGATIPPLSLGAVALAGMVQNRAAKLGVSDASGLLDWLWIHVGPWPSRCPGETRRLIGAATRDAKRLLVGLDDAVMACADLIESGSALDGHSLFRAFKRFSRPPPNNTGASYSAWSKAIRGGDMHALLPSSLWGVCTRVRAEIAGRIA